MVSEREDPERFEHFKRLSLNSEEFLELIEVAKLVNVDFSASVWDLESLNWVKDHLSFVKVGSGDITAYPMLREIAKLSLPVILSTGLSTIGEIRSTIDFIKSVNRFYNNSKNISILQCTSCYPCPIDEVNLQVMTTLKKEFECQIAIPIIPSAL